MSQANKRQVDGEHYKAALQTWDVITDAYGPSFLIGNAVKYITRWRKKDSIKDLAKADHYVEKRQEWHKGAPRADRPAFDQSVDVQIIHNFCRANTLGPMEHEIIGLLLGSWDSTHLIEVRNLIRGLTIERRKEITSG